MALPRIGLIGDHDPAITAHRAIPIAIDAAAAALGVRFDIDWIGTQEAHDAARLDACNGLWCVPGSPYLDVEGAFGAIRFARESGRPFLGTCGGFQHAALEYARNVLGWPDAEHAETSPDASRAVISPLACALVETEGIVHLQAGSRIAAAYGAASTEERYHCRYGVNPRFASALLTGALRAGAFDEEGSVRAVELEGHPFFVATLFQPERAALAGLTLPLVAAFLRAVHLMHEETPCS